MRFSVWPINQQPLADILDVAGHAAATGWDGVWVADHLLPSSAPLDQRVVECWTAMVAVASRVPRVRVGSLVLSNTFRHPAVLAKMVATLDELAPGRIVLGLGTGWQANEHEAFQLELPGPGERLRRLDETCRFLRDMLDHGGTVPVSPVPAERVPLLLGLKGDRALALVARHADEWNLWAAPERLLERSEVLARHCAALGRDPADIRRVAQAVVVFDEPDVPLDPRWARSGLPLLTGSIDQMRSTLAAYRDAGLSELIVPDFALGTGARRRDALDRFITEVAAEFR